MAPVSPPTGSTGTTQPTTPAPAASGSEELAAFALLNKERTQCGFGELTRNDALDTAARGHANWLLLNNYTGHDQVEGTPGFTGIEVFARANGAGYHGVWVEDENASMRRTNTIGFGEAGVRGLLSAPYHLQGLVAGYHDIGISVMGSDEAGTTTKFYPRAVLQIDVGYQPSVDMQAPPSGTVLSYPCDGSSGTFTQLPTETPNPVPGRNLAVAPVGHPIMVFGDAGKVLTISSALVQETVTGNTVSLLSPVTGSDDPNHFLKPNQGFVLPDAPLKLNTQYRVTVVGTNDGASFTKTFTFTTGAIADATKAAK